MRSYLKGLILPEENAKEAAVVNGIQVFGAYLAVEMARGQRMLTA